MRASVEIFARAMELTLQKHDTDKSGWKDCNISWLISRLEEELIELKHAFDNCDPESVIAESIDVANFTMMIYDNLTKESEEV